MKLLHYLFWGVFVSTYAIGTDGVSASPFPGVSAEHGVSMYDLVRPAFKAYDEPPELSIKRNQLAAGLVYRIHSTVDQMLVTLAFFPSNEMEQGWIPESTNVQIKRREGSKIFASEYVIDGSDSLKLFKLIESIEVFNLSPRQPWGAGWLHDDIIYCEKVRGQEYVWLYRAKKSSIIASAVKDLMNALERRDVIVGGHLNWQVESVRGVSQMRVIQEGQAAEY